MNKDINELIKDGNMLQLHELLEFFPEYESKIEASKKGTLEIVIEDIKPNIYNSKIGGHPYFPITKDYPRDLDENPLTFLLQINFEEMPKLKNFPEKGILQFYIDSSNELMGMDFDDRTNNDYFRIIYHENLVESIHDYSFLDEYLDSLESINMPFDRNFEKKFSYKKKVESVNLYCREFTQIMGLKAYPDFIDEEKEKLLNIMYLGTGSKIGGYPFFTNEDPRSEDIYDTLLLQLDSDSNINWPGNGVANFFINKNNLREKDFNNVLFNLDLM